MGSWLGWGAGLFMVGGVVDGLIGLATPFVTRSLAPVRNDVFLLSPRTDTALYGDSPSRLASHLPVLAQVYQQSIDLIGGMLLTFGILQVTVAWFALRRGEPWALGALCAADLVFFASWGLVLSPYLSRGIYPTLAELPSNFWIPAAIFLPAVALSLVGLLQQGAGR